MLGRFLASFSIANRIGAGFGILLLLLGGVSAYSVIAADGTEDSVNRYAEISNATLGAQQIARDVALLRNSVMVYARDGSPEAADATHAILQRLSGVLDQQMTTASDEEKEQLTRMQELVAAYGADFEKSIG